MRFLSCPIHGQMKILSVTGLELVFRNLYVMSMTCAFGLILILALMQNMSEDTDDMFDDLIEKYGKVVYRRNDNKSASEEVDDDAESLSCKLLPVLIAQFTFSVILTSPLVDLLWAKFQSFSHLANNTI